MADTIGQSSRIDRPDHLAHAARGLVADIDLRMEARWRNRGRSWTDDNRRECEQIVGLDDHRITSSVLYAPSALSEHDRVDVTSNHEAPP